MTSSYTPLHGEKTKKGCHKQDEQAHESGEKKYQDNDESDGSTDEWLVGEF